MQSRTSHEFRGCRFSHCRFAQSASAGPHADAEAANLPSARPFREVDDAKQAQLESAKQHLVAVLQGKMGSPSA